MNFQAPLDGRSIRDCGVEMNHLIRPAFPYRAAREIHHTQHMRRIKDQNRHPGLPTRRDILWRTTHKMIQRTYCNANRVKTCEKYLLAHLEQWLSTRGPGPTRGPQLILKGALSILHFPRSCPSRAWTEFDTCVVRHLVDSDDSIYLCRTTRL